MAIRATCLAAAMLALPAAAGAQDVRTVRSEYVVSIFGLVIAQSQVESRIDDSSFRIQVNMRSSGFGAIFDDTRGVTTVSGRFAGGATRPDRYRVEYVSGSKAKNTRIDFSGGNVVSAVNSPPVNTNRPDWVPLQDSHLRDVTDPLSAALVRADSDGEVCSRTISVFDGSMRADIALSPAGEGSASIPGYSGATIVCNARFMPVSGYRSTQSGVRYMRSSSRITVAFAPVGETGVYAPLEASVSTPIGTVWIRAQRFEDLG